MTFDSLKDEEEDFRPSSHLSRDHLNAISPQELERSEERGAASIKQAPAGVEDETTPSKKAALE